MEYIAIKTERQRQELLEHIWRGYGNDYNEVAGLLKSKRGNWVGRCVQCGSWFVAVIRKKRYCCKLCRNRYQRGWSMNDTRCIVCGDPITSIRKRKYCGSRCRERAYYMRKSYRKVNGS